MTGANTLIERTLHDLALAGGYVNAHTLVERVCEQAGLGKENAHSRRAARSYAVSVAVHVERGRRGEKRERNPRSQSRYLSCQDQSGIYQLASLSASRFLRLLKEAGAPQGFNLDAETILELVERPEPELLKSPRPRLSVLAA